MTYPPNASPGAAEDPWSTPDRPGTMPVTPSLATHETPETPDPVVSPGAQDAKADDVSASVAGAVAAAQARYTSHQADTYGQGSTIGSLLDLPGVISDTSKHTGSADAAGSGPAG